MKITIPGEPISKARARSFHRNGRTMHYDPQNEKKNNVKLFFKNFVKDFPEIKNANSYCMTLIFYISYPKSLNALNKNRMSWSNFAHNKKPDIDNLIKFYLDCANEILFDDDQKIVKIDSFKIYSDQPRTEIYVKKNKELNISENIFDVLEIFNKKDFGDFVKDVNKMTNYLYYFEGKLDDLSCKNSLAKKIFKESLEEDEKILTESYNFLIHFANKYAIILNKVRKKSTESKMGVKNE